MIADKAGAGERLDHRVRTRMRKGEMAAANRLVMWAKKRKAGRVAKSREKDALQRKAFRPALSGRGLRKEVEAGFERRHRED